MSIEILYITYNRLSYTQKTLPAMIENAGTDFALTIVDNGSSDGTQLYLKQQARAYASVIKRIQFNPHNQGISASTNQFWRDAQSRYLGKVDNDMLLPKDWLKTLHNAHQQSDQLGVIGGFHYRLEDANMQTLESRVITVDGVSFIPDVFIGGCCYLLPRVLQKKMGYLDIDPDWRTHGWTRYQITTAQAGYYNGYIYPLLLAENFDDPRSAHCEMFTTNAEETKISMADKVIPRKEDIIPWLQRDLERVELGLSLMQYWRPSICKERFNLDYKIYEFTGEK